MTLQAGLPFERPARELLGDGAWLLNGFARERSAALHAAIDAVVAAAPFRHQTTPGGGRMSAAMTNCGRLGWVADHRGYRYEARDPSSGRPWPAMPAPLVELAAAAAEAAGYGAFVPDACLVNRYAVGAAMALHQDSNERDFTQPIVSVSLGLRGLFVFGGTSRAAPVQRLWLAHGDVVVWGGPARRRYHAVTRIEPGQHAQFGRARVNLTFRVAG